MKLRSQISNFGYEYLREIEAVFGNASVRQSWTRWVTLAKKEGGVKNLETLSL